MKRGAKGLFSEGAASNPIIRLARKVTIKEEMGDVALTRKKLKKWSSEFADIKVDGYFFVYMIKRFGFTGSSDKRSKNVIGKTETFKKILSAALKIDKNKFNKETFGTKWNGRYIIEIEKQLPNVNFYCGCRPVGDEFAPEHVARPPRDCRPSGDTLFSKIRGAASRPLATRTGRGGSVSSHATRR
jgi:hypothetical protein